MFTRDSELEARLAGALKGCGIGGGVHAFASVGSTMDVAHELAAGGAGEGTLVWANRQGQGRGRLGRTWTSPEGGAYFSIILRPTRPAAEAPQLSLVAGLAAAEAIRELTGLFPAIRWPNDLLISNKKVGGILIEARSGLGARGSGQASTAQSHVVIGIGINVTTRTEDLPDTATSLLANLPPDSTCNMQHATFAYTLTARLCRQFDRWYDGWTARGFGPIREALRPWMGHFGHPIHISAGSTRFEGTATDLDESGRLVVRLDSGLQRTFEMGEVTLLR